MSFLYKGSLRAVTELVISGISIHPLYLSLHSKQIFAYIVYLSGIAFTCLVENWGSWKLGGPSQFDQSLLKGAQPTQSSAYNTFLIFFFLLYWSIVDLHCGVQVLNKKKSVWPSLG